MWWIYEPFELACLEMAYSRRLQLPALLGRKSFFLFGPRATGKTTLIREQLGEARVYDLLDHNVLSRLSRQPGLLGEENPDPSRLVVIDEIQKLPSLLDEVHRLIEATGRRFLLTGSSARKLKRGAANLLAGRAWEAALLPLSWCEIDDFDLLTLINRGGLPAIYPSPDYREELESYVNLYLREEIHAESVTRNLPGFARFLDAIGLSNGTELNYAGLASDVGVPTTTLQRYVEILQDTLLCYTLEPFRNTVKRKAITRRKLYLFDIGVTNTLARRGDIKQGSELFGAAFEHFVINELRAHLSYTRRREPLTYWRSTAQHEVDAIVGTHLAIEIKASSQVADKHLKSLRALREEGLIREYAVVSTDPNRRVTSDGITIWPWQEFLSALWSNTLF